MTNQGRFGDKASMLLRLMAGSVAHWSKCAISFRLDDRKLAQIIAFSRQRLLQRSIVGRVLSCV